MTVFERNVEKKTECVAGPIIRYALCVEKFIIIELARYSLTL
jgi:hypothetical protein